MKLPHAVRNFIVAGSLVLALCGTGFSAWYYASGTTQAEVESTVKITLCSDNGNLTFTRNTDGNPDHDNDPYIGYDTNSIGIYQNNSFTSTTFSLTYTPFSSSREMEMVLEEELWIPTKTIDNNGNPFSLDNIITISDTTLVKKVEQNEPGFVIYERTLTPLAKDENNLSNNSLFTVGHTLCYTSSYLGLNDGQYALPADTYSSLSKLIEDPSTAIQLVFTARPVTEETDE